MNRCGSYPVMNAADDIGVNYGLALRYYDARRLRFVDPKAWSSTFMAIVQAHGRELADLFLQRLAEEARAGRLK